MSEASHPEATTGLYSRLPRRIQAAALDAAVVVGVLFAAIMVGAAIPSEAASRWVARLGMLNLLCYEPLLTAYAGGTLGHRMLNLRVVDERTGGNLPLRRALLRWAGKCMFGWLSFVSMAATRRHQALHDLLSASTVQVRDPARAEPIHYALERNESQERGGPGVLRRLFVSAAYAAALFVLVGLLSVAVASDACLMSYACSPGENALLDSLTLGWLCATVGLLYLGLRGRLFGARFPAGATDHPAELVVGGPLPREPGE